MPAGKDRGLAEGAETSWCSRGIHQPKETVVSQAAEGCGSSPGNRKLRKIRTVVILLLLPVAISIAVSLHLLFFSPSNRSVWNEKDDRGAGEGKESTVRAVGTG